MTTNGAQGKPMFRSVPIRDLPETFTKDIHDQIRLYSVTMLGFFKDPSKPITCAGTLCNLAQHRGVVTARHVWEGEAAIKGLKDTEKILVIVENSQVPVLPVHVTAIGPKINGTFPGTGAKIPDIAFLKLPADACGRIEAFGKVFYSVEKRISLAESYANEEHGYFALYGAPSELLNAERKAAPSFVYGTNVKERCEISGWDYATVALNCDANPDIPSDFSGVSGGGIWRTPYFSDVEGGSFHVKNRYTDIIFSGVNFWQTASDNRQIIAHGTRSIYEQLRNIALKGDST